MVFLSAQSWSNVYELNRNTKTDGKNRIKKMTTSNMHIKLAAYSSISWESERGSLRKKCELIARKTDTPTHSLAY